MLRVRTRPVILGLILLGDVLTLSPLHRPPQTPPETIETPSVDSPTPTTPAIEIPTFPDFDPDPSPLPPGAICRIRNNAFRHPATISGFTLSADSSTVYTVAGDTTYAWDLNTGRTRWTTRGVPEGEDGYMPLQQVRNVVRVYSPDAQKNRYVELDAASGKMIGRTSAALPGEGVRYPNPNGSRYIWRSKPVNDTYVTEIRDITNRTPPVVVDAVQAHLSLLSPDGRYLIGDRYFDSPVPVYSTETGKCVKSLLPPQPWGGFSPHCFSPDGAEVVGIAGMNAIVGVNLQTGVWRQIAPFEGHHSGLVPMLIDPTGRTLAVPDNYHWVLRDAATGQLRHVLDSSPGGHGQFTPDGKRFVSVAGTRLLVHNVATGEQIGPPVCPVQVRWTHDNHLRTLSGTAVVEWDAFTGRRGRGFPASHDSAFTLDYPYSADLSTDGTRLAYLTTRHTFAVRDLSSGKTTEFPTRYEPTPRPQFVPNGRKLFIRSAEGVHIGDPDTGSDRLALPDKRERDFAYMTMDVSPDGRFLTDWYGKVFDLQTKQPVPLLGRNRMAACWAHFSPDGRHLIGTVRIYAEDEKTDELIAKTQAFGCDGPRGEIRLAVWEMPSGRQVGFFRMPIEARSDPAIFPDGRSLAYLDSDANIVVLELATGKVRARFRTDGAAELKDRYGHRDYGTAPTLTASPDGRFLASSLCGSVLVWDIRGERSRPTTLNADTLENAWRALLHDDAATAFAAIQTLAAFPEQTIPFLQRKLARHPKPEETHVANLIANLSDPDYRTRERAGSDLEALGQSAEPAMQAAFGQADSPEARQRLDVLLTRLHNIAISETPRTLRVVEAVEWIGTAPARELLAIWASGVPGDRLTTEAKLALSRLNRK